MLSKDKIEMVNSLIQAVIDEATRMKNEETEQFSKAQLSATTACLYGVKSMISMPTQNSIVNLAIVVAEQCVKEVKDFEDNAKK